MKELKVTKAVITATHETLQGTLKDFKVALK